MYPNIPYMDPMGTVTTDFFLGGVRDGRLRAVKKKASLKSSPSLGFVSQVIWAILSTMGQLYLYFFQFKQV